MGNSKSVPVDAATRAAINDLGFNKKKPLRLDLNRQYLLKEYLDIHGGYGKSASPRTVLLYVGGAFVIAGVFQVAQNVLFHHSTPKTMTPAYKAAVQNYRHEAGMDDISNHRIGSPVKAHVFDVAKEEEKINNAKSD